MITAAPSALSFQLSALSAMPLLFFASNLKPLTSNEAEPPASNLKPLTSNEAEPPASRLQPQTSDLQPRSGGVPPRSASVKTFSHRNERRCPQRVKLLSLESPKNRPPFGHEIKIAE